jgi:uncharacterized lipoprotein NlpE involved in copper resistance
MSRIFIFLAAAALTSVSFGQASPPSDSGPGAIHYRAQDMDTDKDGSITKDEFMKYHGDTWDRATKNSNGTLSVKDANQAFAKGGMHVNTAKMDADHDGSISKDEYMKYEAAHWDQLPKDANGTISVSNLSNAMKKHRQETPAADAPGASTSNSGT